MAECTTLEATASSSSVSVKACQGKLAVRQRGKVLAPDIFSGVVHVQFRYAGAIVAVATLSVFFVCVM